MSWYGLIGDIAKEVSVKVINWILLYVWLLYLFRASRSHGSAVFYVDFATLWICLHVISDKR